MEKHVSELSKSLVQNNSVYQHKKETLESENESYKSLKENISQVEQSIKEMEEKHENIKKQLAEKRKEAENLITTVRNFKNQLHSINAGIASSNSGKTLTEQLMECKSMATNAATEVQQANITIKHLKKELEEKRKALQKVDDEYEELQRNFKKSLEELKRFNKELEQIGYDEKKYKELQNEKEKEISIITKLKETIGKLSAELSRFDFTYQAPENFDKSKVKGIVANLFDVKDEKTATALEVTAGGKLYNVVVDDENVGKQLIKHGKLNRRVTIIPLNKIISQPIPSQICKKAANIAGGEENARLALSLIDYSKEVEPALKYVFANTLICKDIDTAEKVSFHKDIKKKTVTLRGDSFDPSGTLTGGSRDGMAYLKKLQELKSKKRELEEHQKRLSRINRQLDEYTKLREKYQKVHQIFELKKHEHNLLQSRIEQSKHHEAMEACKIIEKKISECEELRKKNLSIQKENETKCKQIEQDMNNFTNHKDILEKQLKRDIELATKKQQQAKEDVKRIETEAEKAALELEETKSELAELKKKKKEKKNLIKKLVEEFTKFEQLVSAKKSEYEKANSELEQKKASLTEADQELSKLIARKEEKSKEKTSCVLKIKKLEHKLARQQKEQKEADSFLSNIQKEHPWIATEKQFFGKPNSDYDFKARDPKEAQKKLKKIIQDQEKLSKSVNKKVMTMFEK